MCHLPVLLKSLVKYGTSYLWLSFWIHGGLGQSQQGGPEALKIILVVLFNSNKFTTGASTYLTMLYLSILWMLKDRWSSQIAKGQYKDYQVGQLTSVHMALMSFTVNVKNISMMPYQHRFYLAILVKILHRLVYPVLLSQGKEFLLIVA